MFKYTEIGEVLKPFRVNGELLALIDSRYDKDLEQCKAIFFEINGSKVPFFIEYIDDAGEDLFYIKFEEFSSPEEIKKFNGSHLFLRERDIKFARDLNIDNNDIDLSGYHIFDKTTGQRFKIKRTEQYPQQLMAIVDSENKEKLIPLIEQFIKKINIEKKEILMALPDQLLN